MSDAVPPIPADIAAGLLRKDVLNLVKRVQNGGKMSRQERAMLSGIAAGKDGPASVKTTVELAEALGVTRQNLNKWKKLPGAPKPAANGMHDVVKWKEFMRAKDLKGAATSGPTSEDDVQLRVRKLMAEVEQRELAVAIKKGQYVLLDQVATEWTTKIGKAVSLLRNKFENELPPILSGMTAADIQTECRKAIDEVLGILHGGGA